MTKSEFEKLGTEALLQHLSSNGVDVSKIEAIFRDEEIDGQSLLGFTFDNLVDCFEKLKSDQLARSSKLSMT